MIKNVVFDFGNVLALYDPKLFVQRLNLNNPKDEQKLLESVFGVEWNLADEGKLSETEAFENICSKLPIHLIPYANELFWEWYKPLVLIDGMSDLCHDLKNNGYNLYLLSNANLLQNDYWPKMECAQYFSGKLTSAEEKLVKPNEEIYYRFFSKFNLNPEECIFLDDRPKNCTASEKCGMKAIMFDGNVQTARNELRRLNIKC